MADPLRTELAENLHAIAIGDAVDCDYHHRPKTIEPVDAMLFEAVKLIDHPQLRRDEWPSGWSLDAARCADHAVEEIEEPTRGFEEALVEISVTTTNNVVSVETPASEDVSVLAFSPATEGCHPMLLDQQLMDAAGSGDMGLSRWNRVQAMVDGAPAEPFREHIESLIERSAEVPDQLS